MIHEFKQAIENPKYKPDKPFVLPDDPFALFFWYKIDEGFMKTARRSEVLAAWNRFLDHFEDVDIILSDEYGIEIVNRSKECSPDAGFFEEVKEILEEASDKYHIHKGPSTIEHDAVMFVLINSLREGEKPKCLPSNYWLLSADRSLIHFHKRAVKEGWVSLTHFIPVSAIILATWLTPNSTLSSDSILITREWQTASLGLSDLTSIKS